MMILWHLISGYVTVRIQTADYIGLINQFTDRGIVLFHIHKMDDLTIEIATSVKMYRQLKKILDKRDEEYYVLSVKGIFPKVHLLASRSVLLIGMLFIIILGIYIPSRVLFVTVEGNQSVPSNLILDKARECGVHFFSSRKLVRSEKVKNQLISEIPQLQWVGVNTDGCVATIHVAEKESEKVEEIDECGVSSIVASRDGIILACTVLEGTQICKAGQAVKQGETLVSGYTDCGICVRATRAKAEVLAQTTRYLTVLTPEKTSQRGELLSSSTQYSLLIGKKLINFRKYSGISDSSCVKMYKYKYVVLPGGFTLPVALVVKHQYYYERIPVSSVEDFWLYEFAEEYLKSQMISGKILGHDTCLESNNGVSSLSGKYDCIEIIGQTKQEEIIDNYGYD